MTIFVTQHIRDKVNLSWGEEYVLGLVEKTEPITTTRLLSLVSKQRAMVATTAQTNMKSAIDKKLIIKRKDTEDGRVVHYTLTDKGKKLMQELRNAVK